MTRRKRREYTEDFKRQMFQLYKNGKSSGSLSTGVDGEKQEM